MRTQEEIKQFIEDNPDFLNTIKGDLAPYLDFEHVREHLKPEVAEAIDKGTDTWEPEAFDRDKVIGQMRDYMSFAWGKAHGERGISSSRSIDHYKAWLFLIGDDDGVAYLSEDANYAMYGKPMLAWICDKYGFEKE